MNHTELDLVFGALSDTTRRSMLTRLSKTEMNIKTLAEPYAMSQPAISKHVRILERAGLVERTQKGRESIVRANPIPAAQARDWITYYTQLWNQQFDAVEQYLKDNEDES